MNPESLSATPMDDSKKKELLAAFMLAEFNALQDRARDVDQINATRINFYLIIVAAVSAALGTSVDWLTLPSNPFWVVLPALLALLVLGLITYHYSINSAMATVLHYRVAGRIRCWFADLDEDAAGYFPYVAADNRPHFTTTFWMFRGGEGIVVAINALLAAGIAAILLYQLHALRQPWQLMIVAIGVWPIAWFLQRLYFQRRMQRREDKYDSEAIHFVDTDREGLYRHKRDERLAKLSPEH